MMHLSAQCLKAILLLAGLSACSWTVALEQPPALSHDAEKPTAQETKEEESGRLFGVLPAFNVIDAEDAPPMTSGQKFRLALRGTVDPTAFAGAAIKAGVYQGSNFPAGYGQGVGGYGKRFAAAFADGASGKMLSTFVFPALLHQDPRYFRRRQGSIKGRIGYSLSRTVLTRTDSGKQSFNWSKVLGSVGSAALTNAYYPPESRSPRSTGVNIGYSLLFESFNNLMKEFWPDLRRKLRGG